MSPNIQNLLPPDFLSELTTDQREAVVLAVTKAYTEGFIDARRLTELANKNN